MITGKKCQVKFLDRSGIMYIEDERSLELRSQMMVDDDYDVAIYLSRASHWKDGSAVSAEDRSRIKSNLTQELKSSRIEWN